MKDFDRREPPHIGDERATLVGFLNFQRDTFEWKLTGLSDEQLRTRAVEPSTMSLLGMLRHLSDVERGWFRRSAAGEAVPALYWSDDGDTDWEVDGVDVGEALAIWREEVRLADEVAAARSLDDTFTTRRGTEISMRWLLTHMIEEYARHNGHADLLRERLDGETGE